MKAIEVSGTVNHQGQLSLDRPLLIDKPDRVRVIVLIPEDTPDQDEQEDWSHLTTEQFLKGYSASDAISDRI
jgi:hypothetical protein